MKLGLALTASLITACSLVFTAQAAAPEGKGQGNKANNSSNKGNSGKGGPNKSRAHDGNKSRFYDDRHKHSQGDNLVVDLVYAGISAALARDYAQSYGLRGYSELPPGIRKNLARGKPLPPGIAKKIVSSSLLSRLPRHDGYEWRVAGTDLVLISLATAVVADILYDVF